MKTTFESDRSLYGQLENWSGQPTTKFILLSKLNAYQLHRYISTDFDCICEDLTWKNGLIFNTETFTHKDLYDNLFKLEFKGKQLGQEG